MISAVQSGSKVTPFYDPMIGKIIIHGLTRDQAIEKMRKTLEGIDVQGIKTNQPLLVKIMKNDEFIRGEYTTQFLSENQGELLKN